MATAGKAGHSSLCSKRRNHLEPAMNNEEAFELTRWIIAQGLCAVPETEILTGFCERLVASGVPLLRANISQPTLHPVIGGHLFIWHRGEAGAK